MLGLGNVLEIYNTFLNPYHPALPYHASLNIFAIISMLACANVSFPPLFLNSHVYSVCGTLIPSLPPPSLPPLHLLSFMPCHGPSFLLLLLLPMLCRVHCSYPRHQWQAECSWAQPPPPLFLLQWLVSDALCRLLTLTHSTCACCVVACYFSVRPLYFPALFLSIRVQAFIKLTVIFFKWYFNLFYIVLILIVIIKQMWLHSNRIQ